MIVVVNNIVEGAINTIVDIKSLSLTFAAFSPIDFSSDGSWPTYKVTSGLGNKSELSVFIRIE